MPRPLIILFAKAPIAGRVKTRLCPPLTPDQAAALHSAFVMDTSNMLLTHLGVVADMELSTDVPTDAWPGVPVPRSVQVEGDLGARLFHELECALNCGREAVAVLGSDSPGLPATHVLALLKSRADVTLGPTPDGGFYGIACRAINSKMFAEVRWSTEDTLAGVIAGVSASGLTVETGPSWFDVDVEADLLRLLEMPDLPTNTATWARSYRTQ